MRAPLMATVVVLTAFAGCFGPYASELLPDDPPARPAPPVWQFTAGETDLQPILHDPPRAAYRLTGFVGAEPNIGITASGALFMSSLDQTLRSLDNGRTWEEVFRFQPGIGQGPGPHTGDPMLWVDPVTDIVYANHMYPALVCFYSAWSENEGRTWTERDATCTTPGVDHQKFFTAVPGPLAPPVAGLLHPTVLFQCFQRVVATPVTGPLLAGFQTQCNLSYDGGQSWPAETTAAMRVPGGITCGGVNGHPASHTDGTVVVPITRGCDGLYIAVSLDSGLTWTVRAGPKDVGAESIDPDVAFTPDGTLYAIWRGSDHLTYLARSGDVGLTWDGPWRVSPPHVNSTVFQVISADRDGHIAMAFLGTADTDAYPSEAPDSTRWHLYMVTSADADQGTPTVTAHQVTSPNDAVQVGCVWLEGGGHPCRNLLDFIDSAIHPDGTFYVAFTKGCNQGCDDPEDRASLTAIAWLDDWAQPPDNDDVTARAFLNEGW